MSVKLPEELALQLYYYLVANTPHQEIADQEIILQGMYCLFKIFILLVQQF